MIKVEGEKMLENITKDTIVLNQVANDWQEAIKVAAMPLVDAGYIKSEYITDIIENVNMSGPYIVIAPHVAIPHAQSNGNVLKSVIGICTLQQPVKFNNEANDPVKYLFVLAAVDNQDHLQSLSELAVLLEDDDFYRILDVANTPLDILNFLNK